MRRARGAFSPPAAGSAVFLTAVRDRSIRTLPQWGWPGSAVPGARTGGRLQTRRERMDRREFTKVMGAVAAGMLAGTKAIADEAKKVEAKAAAKKPADKAAEKTAAAAEAKGDKHVCKGHNECK